MSLERGMIHISGLSVRLADVGFENYSLGFQFILCQVSLLPLRLKKKM